MPTKKRTTTKAKPTKARTTDYQTHTMHTNVGMAVRRAEELTVVTGKPFAVWKGVNMPCWYVEPWDADIEEYHDVVFVTKPLASNDAVA